MRQPGRWSSIIGITDKLNRIVDLDHLLENILLEARRFTSADAGTIYLVEDGMLDFRYVQNDSVPVGDRDLPLKMRIDESSIAGYVAKNRAPLKIDDAYSLEGCPFAFNDVFDRSTDYETRSILAFPLITRTDVVGVLQLINAKDDEGKPVPFREEDIYYENVFAMNVAVAIERAKRERASVMKMLQMAEMRDPKETGPHVERVAEYSVAILKDYMQGSPEDEISEMVDKLRISAKLHDIGKVGIPDNILKKPGRLDDYERHVMKRHTILGAEIFSNPDSPWDSMARDIALNHHERYDGKGYPGIYSGNGSVIFGKGKEGDDIPLAARIVAIADVFDALISRRSYKDGWDEGRVLENIYSESGKQFDPSVTESFFRVYDKISTIRGRIDEPVHKAV